MIERLERLAAWSGRCFRDASYVPALAFGIDPRERERQLDWRQVYLSRYGRISISEQEELPAYRLNAYVQQVSAILKKEAPLSTASEEQFV